MRSPFGVLLASSILVMVSLSGCALRFSTDGSDDQARIYWGQSSKSCQSSTQNGAQTGGCTYGQNAQLLQDEVKCDDILTLVWNVRERVAGSVSLRVLDPAGSAATTQLLVSNGQGTRDVTGSKGTWVLEGQTMNANGKFEATLTCGPAPT